jgi:hypothetical protein
MAMMHNNLIAYYEKVFALKQYHNWTLSEIESLIPWELDVMTSFLNNYLELQDMQRKHAQNSG